jgi:hypothetical protein
MMSSPCFTRVLLIIIDCAIYKGLANQLQIGETASIPELQTTIGLSINEIILNF